MIKLSHDGIAEDADLVSVWGRLAEKFKRQLVVKAVDDAIFKTAKDLELMREFGNLKVMSPEQFGMRCWSLTHHKPAVHLDLADYQ